MPARSFHLRPAMAPNSTASASASVAGAMPTPPVSASTGSSSSPPPDRPAKRRRSGTTAGDCCGTCRRRKVKCPGNPGDGACNTCFKLEIPCSFTSSGGFLDGSDGKVKRVIPSQTLTEAGTIRKRAQKACRLCHEQKTKCGGERPTCKRCEAAGSVCKYDPPKRKFNHIPKADDELSVKNPAASPVMLEQSVSSAGNVVDANFPLSIDTASFTAEERLTRKNLILTHVDAYMVYLYWMPCLSFLHPKTVYAQIDDGSIPPAHAAAICAVTSFFVNPGKGAGEFGLRCSEEVEFHIFRNIHTFSESNLILFCLNMGYHFLSGTFAKVWQCFGIASRVMTGLQMPWDGGAENQTFAQQETRRRVAWHLFCFDRLLAGGYDEYTSVRAEIMKIRLPCDENSFRNDQVVVADRLSDRPKSFQTQTGIHGWSVRLVDIRHRINTATRKFTTPASGGPVQKCDPSDVKREVTELQDELSIIHHALPEAFTLTDQNIANLPGLRESTSTEILRMLPRDFISKSQKQAVAHALCMARFCDTIQREFDQIPNKNALGLAGDTTISHMATQCFRVLLTALQHNLYHDLYDHSSAPLWRREPADEEQIRFLFQSLFRISEAWCPVLITAKHAHESNLKMVRQFDETRKFADPRGPGRDLETKLNGDARGPGPHFVLDNANLGIEEQERRLRANDAAVAARWFQTPQPSPNDSNSYPVQETNNVEGNYGPPGIPMLLISARGMSLGASEPNMYNTEMVLQTMQQNRQWPLQDYNSMVMPADGQMMAPPEMAMMPMDGAAQPNGYHQHAPDHQQFMPPQPGVFMNGYQTQYDNNGHADTNGYMHHHQTAFG